jgi:hypothetical protein
MSTEVYRAYLDGLDLTQAQKDQLIESLYAICENIIEDFFRRGGEGVK